MVCRGIIVGGSEVSYYVLFVNKYRGVVLGKYINLERQTDITLSYLCND